ncbi:TPA: hypothetical protein ACF256_000629 [Klebsiella pneumoniae]
MITSIFIDAKLPIVPGMKKLSDFEVKNWFGEFPDVGGVPYAGYYFGRYSRDITLNNFNVGNEAVLYGAINNDAGYISVNNTNYIDTLERASEAVSIGIRIRKRGDISGGIAWCIADFSGTGGGGVGFALGITSDGKIRFSAQNSQQAMSSVLINIPASISVGDNMAITANITPGIIELSVYDPETQQSSTVNSSLPGRRTAGINNILIGRKTDYDTSGLYSDISAALIINGTLSAMEHTAVQQFLYNMD